MATSSSPVRMPTCRGAACAICVIAWLTAISDINLDVVWETVQEWLPALLQQLPAVRQDADDEDRNDNCERGSPMTVESRIFSVAEYVQPSEGEPIRSGCALKPETQLSWFGMSIPGRKLRLTFIPHGQD